MDTNGINLTGAVCAVIFYVTSILVFVSRLAGWERIGWWSGATQFLLALPLAFLLIKAPSLGRPPLYYIQIGLMLAWLLASLLLDYIFKVDFRKVLWAVICYVILFFAAGGGMIGVASYAGALWTSASGTLFLASAALAFIQRFITGK